MVIKILPMLFGVDSLALSQLLHVCDVIHVGDSSVNWKGQLTNNKCRDSLVRDAAAAAAAIIVDSTEL